MDPKNSVIIRRFQVCVYILLFFQCSICRGVEGFNPPLVPKLTSKFVLTPPQKNSQNKSKIHCWPPLVFQQIDYWLFWQFVLHLHWCLPVRVFLRQQYGNLKWAWGSSLKKIHKFDGINILPANADQLLQQLIHMTCSTSSKPPTQWHPSESLHECQSAYSCQFNLSGNYHTRPSNFSWNICQSSHFRLTMNLGLSMCITRIASSFAVNVYKELIEMDVVVHRDCDAIPDAGCYGTQDKDDCSCGWIETVLFWVIQWYTSGLWIVYVQCFCDSTLMWKTRDQVLTIVELHDI